MTKYINSKEEQTVMNKRWMRLIYNKFKIFINYINSPVLRNFYLHHADKLLAYKNIHAGKSCFIIGNGPSLNKMDLAPIKECHSFGLNKIYLMFDKVDLNIDYLVSVNRLVIEQSIKEFELLRCPVFLSYGAAYDIKTKADNIKYILASDNINFQKDITKEIYEGFTVTYVAMQLAFYMGFSKVFLIGVDHNFKASGKPNEKQLMVEDDANHFDPNYFRGKNWHLADLEGAELAYSIARFVFNRDNREIYDATIEGKCNIFKKISYEAALSECKNHK